MSGELILVTGGSGSGKSAFAERTLLSRARGRAVYLATMSGADAESLRRIRRHRDMRRAHGDAAGLHFTTLERPVDLGGADIRPGDAVLLEDLGNLLANEIWSPGGAGEGARERILSGVDRVLDRAETLVVVSVEVFSDGCRYDPETLRYIRTLGELHQDLARRAVAVAEVVCGIPVWRKGPPGPAATERAV